MNSAYKRAVARVVLLVDARAVEMERAKSVPKAVCSVVRLAVRLAVLKDPSWAACLGVNLVA